MRIFAGLLLLVSGVAWGDPPKPGSASYYERLGVAPSASRDEIVNAFVTFMRRTGHSAEAVRRVTEAHDMLVDTERRLSYDARTADTPVLSNLAVAGTEDVIQRFERAIAKLRSIEVLRHEYAAATDGPPVGSDRPRYFWYPSLRKRLDLVFRDRALQIFRKASDPVVRAEALCFVSDIHASPMEGLLVSLHAEDEPIPPILEARLLVLSAALQTISQPDWARALVWHEALRQARAAGDREAVEYIAHRVLHRLVTHTEVSWPSSDEAARVFLTGLIATDFKSAEGVFTLVRLLKEDGGMMGILLQLIRAELPQTAPKGWVVRCGEALRAAWRRFVHARRAR